MNLRIRFLARRSEFRGEMLARNGQDPDEWDLEKYADAAYAWMRRAHYASKDGEKKWVKIERDLWAGIPDRKRHKQQVAAMLDTLGGMGASR